MYLNSNPVLYAGLFHVIKRGTAEILEYGEHGVFLRDTVSNIYMLAADSADLAIAWLEQYESASYVMLVVFQAETAAYATKRYQMTEKLECFQAAYLQRDPPVDCSMIQIRMAAEEDFTKILTHYDKLSEDELKAVIQRDDLFVGCRDGEMVGFVGQHLEGSMGMLEIFPQYRRNGYGKELEIFLIKRMMERGEIPFCQIEVDNIKSINLQKNLGLTISEEKIYFLFKGQD